MEDAPNDTSYASTSVSTTVSPAYAAPPRRRMMGPREPGSAPPARRGREPSPVSRHQRSATGPEQAHPFARDASPTPRPFERDISPSMATTLPLRTQSQSRPSPAPSAAYAASLQPTPEPTPSPASSATAPSPASVERTMLEASTTATKRPLTAASPRATPAKKVASLAMAFENGGSPSFPRGSSPSSSSAAQPLRTSHRSVSNSSTASASRVPSASYTPGRAGGRSGRRVASNASTIRGISPPPKPKVAEEMDVFDDVPSSASRREQFQVKEVMEDEVSRNWCPSVSAQCADPHST